MPLYIKDEETSDLLERYAAAVGANKTAALRELLRSQLETIHREQGANARYKSILQLIGPKLAGSPAAPISKERIDALYDDTEQERAPQTKSDRKARRRSPVEVR